MCCQIIGDLVFVFLKKKLFYCLINLTETLTLGIIQERKVSPALGNKVKVMFQFQMASQAANFPNQRYQIKKLSKGGTKI